ncbi:hypothetical protein BDQ12DRAFT_700969 [Crucibulum laeve]|uniref:Uncharacterized protein n=1 Tax=Crucibulum laeve TaxID=68775 RepID=A0A5C3LK97_9AGAR|nr:hypothetical protein BDQ12DRAFT_700969 [Crucibulum laeve]
MQDARWTYKTSRRSPCDKDGYKLPMGAPPPPWTPHDPNNYSPFISGGNFLLANFLFHKIQMSGGSITKLMEILANVNSQNGYDGPPPFVNADDLYKTIDSIELFTVKYNGDIPANAPFMEDQIDNPDFAKEMDYAPKQVYSRNQHQYCNLMSGNWAWGPGDPTTHRAMFAPIVLGSDKMTVSVATGQNEYYPLYALLGNIQNHILLSLKPWMRIPHITHCGDGHFCHIIYGLGPYIGDYLEQILLACVVSGWCPNLFQPFTSEFPHAGIHELLAPDLLHQIIKGAFKDHLNKATVPPFSGLHHFPERQGFKQWTGDDSKALMKLIHMLMLWRYLAATVNLVPAQMVKALSAFMEFCYLVHQSQIDKTTLTAIDVVTHICDDLCLPRQHSIMHYHHLIQQFGAPNGLCSSITESKHIKAYLDKLTAAHLDFECHEMLGPQPLLLIPDFPSHLPSQQLNEEAVEGISSLGDYCYLYFSGVARGYPKQLDHLSGYLHLPELGNYIQQFLYDQLYHDLEIFGMDAHLKSCPSIPHDICIDVHHSAISIFHAPSDLSGIGGMKREWIQATPLWQKGLHVAQVGLFFSFKQLPCNQTGMWMVETDTDANGYCLTSVIHIDLILHSAHLIPPHNSLGAFQLFYVNKYADHHVHEIAF